EVLSNSYGTVALVRRELLPDELPTGDDAAWMLLAQLKAGGARIVSVPIALVDRAARPGDVLRNPADGLRVVNELERSGPATLETLPRLAAGLAAATASSVDESRRTSMRRAAARAYARVSRRRAQH